MSDRVVSHKSRDVLLPLYKSLVRPHLECCISAWSPYYQRDKCLLERVQHKFTRIIPGMKQLSYEQRLDYLGLWSLELEERRNRADLLEVFKMYKGWSTISFDSMFTLMSNSRTRGHTAKMAKNRHETLFLFSQRVIDRWNDIDQRVIDASSVNAFKSGRLHRIRDASTGFFMD